MFFENMKVWWEMTFFLLFDKEVETLKLEGFNHDQRYCASKIGHQDL